MYAFKHDINPFSMLIRDNIHVLYVYKLIRLTKSAGAWIHPFMSIFPICDMC